MKMLEKIINQLPANTEDEYSVNIAMLLNGLLEHEIDIPNDLYEECTKKRLIGSAIAYLKNLGDVVNSEEGITYDWGGRISNDFYYLVASTPKVAYVAMQVNVGTEVRCYDSERTTNNSYTDACLLKFQDRQDFFELLEELATENATFSVTVDGRSYLVTPQIQSEVLIVKDIESGEEIPGIYASDDEEFAVAVRSAEVRRLLEPRE